MDVGLFPPPAGAQSDGASHTFSEWPPGPPWQERQAQHLHMVPPSVLCREVGLLKINVERAEWDVLAGIQPQDWPKVSARTRPQQQQQHLE